MQNSESTRIKKVLTVIALVVMLIATTFFSACSCSGADAAEKFKDNVVSIVSSGGSGSKNGSGVLLFRDDNTPICLTSYHVVSDNNRIIVTPSDGNSVTAEVIGYSEYHDIAVLGLTADHGTEFLDVLDRDLFASAEMGAVFSIGDKNASGINVYEGECLLSSCVISAETVGNLTKTKFVPAVKVTCDIGEGMSGGAVLNDRGELIGIGAYRDDTENVYYAVSSSVARAVLDAALKGDVDEKGEVILMGNLAAEGRYSAFLTSAYGDAAFLAQYTSREKLHALGFSGSFLSEGGLQISKTGSACKWLDGALITELGGVKVSAKNMNEVFAAFYGYRLSDSEEGNALSVKYITDGCEQTANLSGGGFSMIGK